MDFLSVEPDSSNTKDILVITDHFTKYAVAIPTRNQKAQTVAKCLWDQFLVHYGFPEKLHSDQGPDFESHTIRELCKIAGIRKVRTTPYHPRGNPVERFNRTLLQMLGTLENKQKAHWKEYVKPLVHAYNCTRNDVTGYSPYELMFGRQPRLPLDIAFGILNDEPYQSHSKYVTSLKNRLEESYKLALENSMKVAERNKKRFDSNVVVSVLEVGDRVLVRNVRLRGKQKLADKWESDVYIVLKKVQDVPVYTICPEGTDSPVRTLHRDLLLPCGFLPGVEADKTTLPKVHQKCQTGPQSCMEHADEAGNSNDEENSESDSYCFVPRENLEVVTRYIPHESSSHHLGSPPITDTVEVAGTSQTNVNSLKEKRLKASEVIRKSCDGVNKNLPVSDGMGSEIVEIEPGGCRTNNDVRVSWEEESNNSEALDEYSETEVLYPVEKLKVVQIEKDDPKLETVPEDHLSGDGMPGKENSPNEGVRRSARQIKPPKKFHYPHLGNPLISVVQSLLQGLSAAFAQSEENSDFILNQSAMVPGDPLSVMTTQPFACPRTCIRSKGRV
ncbi:uncharacterized protein LOC127657592 [Xyrauchen texanus]|uniref:uncharacterized protein LOC127657592 n=1 Tax=Xyrauchen texanus TaxID=154827 RepID=UPI00224272F3|nr:uncharacterized protein LOC127657592 [Xyrauchen texanus]XP_052002421.1 uncharacterized protein LOC127657592 [Xyrauchen texanus]